MAAKSISAWCTGALVVGAVLGLGNLPMLAAWEVDVTGQAGSQPGLIVPTPQTSYQPLPSTTPPTVLPAPPATPLAGPAQTPPAGPTQTPPYEASQMPATVVPIPATSGNDTPPPTTGQPESTACEQDNCSDFCGALFCGSPGRVWLRGEYLMWWTKGVELPPLVTTGSEFDPPEQAGAIGYPNTQIIFGDRVVGADMRSGVRTTIGLWLDDCHRWSFEVEYLTIGSRSSSFSQSFLDNSVLARPYFNVYLNTQASHLVAYPGLVEGRIDVEARSDFQSIGEWIGYNLCSSNECGGCEGMGEQVCDVPFAFGSRTDLLIGFRYCRLNDYVSVSENLVNKEFGPYYDTTSQISDNFRTRNDFCGSEIGLRTQLYRGRWSLDILTRIALGNNHQTVSIEGSTQSTGEAGNDAAGVLALGSNSGTYTRDSLTLIPQLTMRLGYQLNCRWRAYVGYDVLYWGSVMRAADQIDFDPINSRLNVDSRNIPPTTAGGLPFPQYPGKSTDFWAQGINLGTEFRF
jgi:hypothetical protein